MRPSAAAVPFWGDALLRDIIDEHLVNYPLAALNTTAFLMTTSCLTTQLEYLQMWLYTRPRPHQHNAIDSFDNIVDWTLGRLLTEILATYTVMLCCDHMEHLQPRIELDAMIELYNAAKLNHAEKVRFKSETALRRIENFADYFKLDTRFKTMQKDYRYRQNFI